MSSQQIGLGFGQSMPCRRRLREARGRLVRLAYSLTLVPYFTGAALSIGAGLLKPGGMLLVAISAAAASLGGMCGFAWGPQLLRDATFIPASPDGPIPIARSWPWIIFAAAIAIPFVGVLGPGIRF